jgi:nicotinamidase-related amidase
MDIKTALILIDIQKAFDDIEYWGGNRNNPGAEQNAAVLLTVWRELKLPLFHIKHCSLNPASGLAEGNPGNEFKDLIRPVAGETIIKKNVNSAFIGTDLKQLLDEQGISSVVFAGLTTDHCVSTTTRMAGNYGYKAYLAADATATFDKIGINGEKFDAELIHQTALASLKDEFAVILNTEEIIKEMKKSIK